MQSTMEVVVAYVLHTPFPPHANSHVRADLCTPPSNYHTNRCRSFQH